MKVAFIFAGKTISTDIALAMIASCQKVMPGIEIVQQTDMDTPELPGCRAERLPIEEDWGLFSFKHWINLEGEVIKLDYDMIVQKDVRKVFRLPFDVALTRRPLNDVTVSNSIRVGVPHNNGVQFLRNSKAFFEKARDEYLNLKKNGWMDVSIAFEYAAASNVCRWIELDGEIFNYTPYKREEDLSKCAIVHYKGDRKKWMVESPSAQSDGQEILRRLKAA